MPTARDATFEGDSHCVRRVLAKSPGYPALSVHKIKNEFGAPDFLYVAATLADNYLTDKDAGLCA